MKKVILFLIFGSGLLSCSLNNFMPVIKAGITESCEKNSSEIKIAKINVPGAVGNTPQPDQVNSINIEANEPVYPSKAILNDEKFVAVYNYLHSSLVVGKIFNKDGQEIVSRFKILDVPQNKQVKFKVITHKKLDYFLIFYSFFDNYSRDSQNNFFIKKFDLEGNQIGKEIKLDSNTHDFTDANYSFDENGKNLILSWTTLAINYPVREKYSCKTPTCFSTAGPNYYNPIINIITFDEKLNYCFKKVAFEDLIVSTTSQINFSKPYITKNRDKIIFTLNDQTLKEINLKDLKSKNDKLKFSLELYERGKEIPNIFNQDNDGNFYFLLLVNYGNYSNHLYKTDSNFNIILDKTFELKDIQVFDLSTFDNKILISPQLFIDDKLNIYKYAGLKSINLYSRDYIFKLGNNILVSEGNFFSIIKM